MSPNSLISSGLLRTWLSHLLEKAKRVQTDLFPIGRDVVNITLSNGQTTPPEKIVSNIRTSHNICKLVLAAVIYDDFADMGDDVLKSHHW